MGAKLLDNSYGKSGVRLTKVKRDAASGRHELIELEVAIALEGDFETAHTRGDNSQVLPTDTMKNTVYALAKDHPIDSIEAFGLSLARHFVGTQKQVSRTRVTIERENWDRLAEGGREHPHCFVRGSEERAVCEVAVGRDSAASIVSGFDGLVLLKTTDSAFSGYPRDRYTTLKETRDRIMASSVTARWTHSGEKSDFEAGRARIRTAMIAAFGAHKSESVQHTLYAMGEAALAAAPEISQVQLSMPNQHRILVDLSPFGMNNENEVFVTTSEPYGLIEATIARS